MFFVGIKTVIKRNESIETTSVGLVREIQLTCMLYITLPFYGCNVIIADPGYKISEWSVTFDLTLLSIDNIHPCIAFSVCEFANEGKGAEHLATSKCAASDNIYKEAFFVHRKCVNININFHCLLISLIDKSEIAS